MRSTEHLERVEVGAKDRTIWVLVHVNVGAVGVNREVSLKGVQASKNLCSHAPFQVCLVSDTFEICELSILLQENSEG